MAMVGTMRSANLVRAALVALAVASSGSLAAAQDIPAGWSVDIKPKRAILTHMHVDLDYDTLRRTLPPNVEPGFDGMAIELPA